MTTRSNLIAAATWYPSHRGGFFLKGGLGAADRNQSTKTGNTTVTVRDQGFGMTLGAGLEVRAGRNLYVSPNVDLIMQTINNVDTTIGLFSIGVIWH